MLPGSYAVTLNVAGRQLKGELRVEGDPRVTFPDADRRTRQTALLNLYDLQKTLAAARLTVTAASSQSDARRREGEAARENAGSRLARIRADITRELGTINNLSRAIEGYSGLPTADQKKELDWAFEDASKTIEAVNRLLRTDTPMPAPPVPAPSKRY